MFKLVCNFGRTVVVWGKVLPDLGKIEGKEREIVR
jgi:hypothetical protein